METISIFLWSECVFLLSPETGKMTTHCTTRDTCHVPRDHTFVTNPRTSGHCYAHARSMSPDTNVAVKE